MQNETFKEIWLKLKELKPLIDDMAESNDEAFCELAIALDKLRDEMVDSMTSLELDRIETEADDLAFLDGAEEEAGAN